MNKTVVYALAALLVVGGLVVFARPGAKESAGIAEQNSGALAAVEPRAHDFGTISMAAGTVAHRFTVKNTGTTPVLINKLYTSCMCTTAILTLGGKTFGPYGMPGHMAIPTIGQTIAANEEATVDVTFDPAAHGPAGVGKIERVVTIENDAGRSVELAFSAVVTP